MRHRSSPRIAVLDVDGTLVDTDHQHALAWYRAFRSLGETYPVWRIHRLIGNQVRDAGAVGIYDTPADLTAELDATALA